MSNGWNDQDWAELLACMRRRKVIPVIGEELLQVEIEGETVPLYTWMAKRLASELGVSAAELPSPASLNDVACLYLARSDSNRNSIYMRLWIVMDEAKANLRAPLPLRQLAEITDFNLFLTTTFDSLMESALDEIRKKETESLMYSPTDRQDIPAGKDLLPPTVYHLFGALDVSPTYAVSREDLLEWIYAMESQPRPKNLFDELRQNYILILGAQFSDWLPWFLRLRVEKRLSESRDWFEYLADNRKGENADLVFLRHFSKQTKRYEGGAVRFVEELWTRWTKNRPLLPGSAPLPLPTEPPRGAIFVSYASEDLDAAKKLKAGIELVSREVGEQIVRFVAAAGQHQARVDGAGSRSRSLQELDVEPALLSLFCRELNDQRIVKSLPQKSLPQITTDLVEKSSEQILQNYYERCFAGQAMGARIFVEEELLTPDGHRDDIELQRATEVLKELGAAATCLEKLIDRRLLHLTRRGEMLRVELSHDVLTGVVSDSRNKRHVREADERRLLEERRRREAEQKQREAEKKQRQAEARERESETLRAQAVEAERLTRKALNRSRLFLILAVFGLVFAVFYAFTSARNKRRAQEQLAHAQIEEGRAWIERAKLNSTRGNHFAAALMAARALGFAGFGREKNVDPKFNEEYPILLTTANDPIDEQEARRQINEDLSARYFGYPLWQSPEFRQHEGPVECVAWSPDGKKIASASDDKTVKLWEAATGKLLSTLQGHTDKVTSVTWSPDGETLASGSSDQTVKLWNVATGKLLTSLQGHAANVISVAWSPDGKTLASGSIDQMVKLWEAATGKLLGTLQGHGASVISVAWSPDGKTLASGSDDQTVKLWEAASGKLLASFNGHTDRVWSVAWSPDGKKITSASGDKTVKVWEVATDKLLSTLQGHTDTVTSVAWSPDGKILASGSGDQTVKLWEAASGKLLTTLHGHTEQVLSVAWSPDGKTIASASRDHTVMLWEAATGKLLTSLDGHTDSVWSVAWSPDGKTLASGSHDNMVMLWEAPTGKLLSTLQGHADRVTEVAWSPDGKTLASASHDNTVKLWEAATGKLLSTLQGHTGTVYSVAWSPDGKTIASASDDKTVKLWDAV